jgi:hypothetical protein
MARRASAAGEIETAEAACTEWGVLGGASREGEDLGRNPAGHGTPKYCVYSGAGRLVDARSGGRGREILRDLAASRRPRYISSFLTFLPYFSSLIPSQFKSKS